MAPQYKLYYFPIRMRAEFIRYIFAYTDTPYEEVTIGFEEWFSTLKQKMPMHILPVLELSDGRQLSQSLAISRYLGTELGLISTVPYENAMGDQLVGAIEDIYPTYYRDYALAFLANDEGKKASTLQILKEKGFEPLFTTLEKFLGDKKWFCGGQVHWADVVIAELVDRVETNFDQQIVKNHPKLAAHCKRIHENASLKKHVEKRPPMPM